MKTFSKQASGYGPAGQSAKQILFRNKYSLLLMTLILLLIISPVVDPYPVVYFLADSILLNGAVLLVSLIHGMGKAFFRVYAPVTCLAVLFYCFAVFTAASIYLIVPAILLYMAFLAMAIIFIVQRIFSERRVTGDTVKGGISVYILIGFWWQMLYTLIWALNPAAFSLQIPRIDSPDFFYFSFTTLTTLGYGDVISKSYAAKTAAILQAITGQMYLAILVARLVSLHISHSEKK